MKLTHQRVSTCHLHLSCAAGTRAPLPPCYCGRVQPHGGAGGVWAAGCWRLFHQQIQVSSAAVHRCCDARPVTSAAALALSMLPTCEAWAFCWPAGNNQDSALCGASQKRVTEVGYPSGVCCPALSCLLLHPAGSLVLCSAGRWGHSRWSHCWTMMPSGACWQQTTR